MTSHDPRPRTLHPSGPNLLVVLALLFIATVASGADDRVAGQVAIATDFPGGSAEVVKLDADTQTLHIRPALQTGRGWPCWWYFRVDGLRPGKPVTLKISPAPGPFVGQRVLAAAWAHPRAAAISTDNVHWSQTKPGESAGGVATYQFDAPAERLWLAWGPPFGLSEAEDLLARVAAQRPGAERFTLAHTREGRAVHGIRVGGDSPQQPATLGVWVHARQHAWEAGSSWVGRGFLEWIAGDDPGAVELRKRATIYFVPIMDVDNVSRGAGGKDAVPHDQNRDWSDTPVYPEVAAAQRRLLELDRTRRLDVMIDLHNPGPTDHQPFFYGPFDLDKLSPVQQRNYRRWLELTKKAISGPLLLEPAYRVSSYMTPNERLRASTGWVLRHTAPEVVVVCLETSWNTPQSTTEGYMTVGRQLAAALSHYLAEDPRRPVDREK